MSFVAWIVFSLSVATLADGPIARTVVFLMTSSGMFARGYYHFDQYLLSDSIAMSLLLLWFSVLVPWTHWMARLATKSAGIYGLCLGAFLCLTWLVSNARDTHMFLVLLGMLVACRGIARYSRGDAVMMMLLILGMIAVQNIDVTGRHGWNLTNVITGAILPYPERVEFFRKHGMRISDDEVARYRRVDRGQPVGQVAAQITRAARSRAVDNGKLLDEVFAQNGGFIRSQGEFLVHQAKRTYVLFLATHPMYVINNVIYHANIIFNPTTPDQAADPRGPVEMPGYARAFSLIDYLPLGWLVALSCLAAGRLAVSHELFSGPGGAGLLLVIAGVSNAVIAFHGDLWEISEMERHCFIGSILFKTGCGLLLVSAACTMVGKKETE